MWRKFLHLLIVCCIPSALFAQGTVVFSGIVTDPDGEILPGVSLSVSDRRIAIMTNAAGEFSFSTDNFSGKTVTFSYIGMKTVSFALDKVADRIGWRVILEPDTRALDEVTVTALGIPRRERAVGYAVTTMKNEVLDPVAPNPVAALQGKVAGLHISGAGGGRFGRQKVTLRGASTLNSNNQPLLIIDGIAVNTSVWVTAPDWTGASNDWGDELKNLNVADIESVSVLKGAAATALYGSRGINGALVITTKGGTNITGRAGITNGTGTAGIKGRADGISGTGGGGTTVKLVQSIGFDQVTATPKMQTLYGPGTIAGDISYGERHPNGGFYRWDTEQFYLDAEGRPTLIGANNFLWGPRFDGRAITQYDGTQGSYSAVENGFRRFTGRRCKVIQMYPLAAATTGLHFTCLPDIVIRTAHYPLHHTRAVRRS